jgi:hypothetical protein
VDVDSVSDVSEVHAASIVMIEVYVCLIFFDPEDGGSIYLRKLAGTAQIHMV